MSTLEKFLNFEVNNSLLTRNLCGYYYWQFLRLNIYREIIKKQEGISDAQTNTRGRAIKRLYLRLINTKGLVEAKRLDIKTQKDILILNHPRRIKTENYYDCIYTDLLLENIQYSYITLERMYNDKHFSPIRTKNLLYLDYIELKAGVKLVIENKILKKSNKAIGKESEWNFITKLERKIEDEFKVKIYLNDIVKRTYIQYKEYRKYFRELITKISPKIVIEVVGYNFANMVINEIAKEEKIPVVELQHGSMGKYHIAYNYLDEKMLNTFPDYVFAFGEYWKCNSRLPIDNKRIKITGWPYYEKKLSVNIRRSIREDKKVILFISQGTIGEQLSRIAFDLSKIIDLNMYKIIYKLHPGEYNRLENEYRYLLDSDIEIVDNNEHDMHYYFSQSDIQVGVYSTAIYEGLGYGLKTYIFKLYGYCWMEELYKDNTAILVESVNQLASSLEKKVNERTSNGVSYFWENNSIDNMLNEINKIINKEQ